MRAVERLDALGRLELASIDGTAGIVNSRRSEDSLIVIERVPAVLDQLPDNCAYDDVLHHLYVVQAVERGVTDADAGRMIPMSKSKRSCGRGGPVDSQQSRRLDRGTQAGPRRFH